METITEDTGLDLLDAGSILGADDLEYEVVEVPEWRGRVRVRALTGEARDAFEESLQVGRGKQQKTSLANFRAKLVARTLCDAEGNLLFTEKDIRVLGQKSAAALARVAEVASRLSGLSKADVEDMVDDLGNAPGADS